jgi:hypothetical protein
MTFTKRIFGTIVSLLFLLSCLSQVSHADVSYEQKIKSSGSFGFGGTETQSTVLLKGDRQKTVTETAFTGKLSKLMAKGGAKTVEITRLDKELMWNIDLDGKKYTEITFEEMKKMFGEMEKAIPEVDSLKAEEEKAQEPKVEVSVTGEKKKIAGYPCEQVIVKMTMEGKDEGTGEKPTYIVNSDMWLTKDFPGQKEIREFQSKMSEKLGMGQGQGESVLSAFTRFGVDVDKLSQEMKKVEGFPMLQTITMEIEGEEIETEEETSAEAEEEDLEEMPIKGLPEGILGEEGKEGGNVIFSITTEVTQIKTDNIGESEFELPPGLQKETKR